jgi:hypothetical protein
MPSNERPQPATPQSKRYGVQIDRLWNCLSSEFKQNKIKTIPWREKLIQVLLDQPLNDLILSKTPTPCKHFWIWECGGVRVQLWTWRGACTDQWHCYEFQRGSDFTNVWGSSPFYLHSIRMYIRDNNYCCSTAGEKRRSGVHRLPPGEQIRRMRRKCWKYYREKRAVRDTCMRAWYVGCYECLGSQLGLRSYDIENWFIASCQWEPWFSIESPESR